MQSFPSSIKNDGRAALNKHYNNNKNIEGDKQTYAPKYAQNPHSQNNVNKTSNRMLTQKARNSSNSENDEKYEQTLAFSKRENDSTHLSQTKNNKGYLRRPNSAIAYRDTNSSRQVDGQTTQNLIDFNIESFLNKIQVENEPIDKEKYKPKKIKKKSRTRPTSPSDSSDPNAPLPQQFVKLPEKKKEINKAKSPPRSTDYSHLNGPELYPSGPNMEKFGTRLTKESRKDAALQRSILAKYTQNQVEYIGLIKEKKKSAPSDKLPKTIQSNDNNTSQLDDDKDEELNFKANNDDSYEFNYNSDTSTSANSSTNQQQKNQEKNDKNKNIFSKNEDKFSHLNYRMTSSINYNDLAKAQSKYTKKIKDTNKSTKNVIKRNDNRNETKSTIVPPRLFFSRTPLFDDPENPKQRETQRILPNRSFQKQTKERASSSRIYFHNSNIKKETNDYDQNELTPQEIPDQQNLGPTPQTKESNGTLPMLNSPEQRPSTNLSNFPPRLFLSTPHSKSYHNSARKNDPPSLFGANNKDNNDISLKKSNRPPIIPNSRSNSNIKGSNIVDNKKSFNKYADDINEPNDFPNSSRSMKSYSASIRNNLNSTDPIVRENLIPKPRSKQPRNRTSSHRSLIVGSDKDSLFAALAKLHNFSDSTSPPTPTSSNSTNNRWQNNQGIFKLNPILPSKKPKEENIEEKEQEEDEKPKPIDSITFQMTALEKFKKDKKRKQLEEKGFYRYKKETIHIKKNQKEDDESKNKSENENDEEFNKDDDQEEEDDSSKNLSYNTQTSIPNETDSQIASNYSDDSFNDYDEKELSQNEDTEVNPSEIAELTEK